MKRRQIPILAVFLLPALAGADWLQFRGPNFSAIAPGEAAPQELGADKNVAWRTELPGRGLSCPIVVGDKIYLTASNGPQQDRLHVLAYSAGNGRQLWQ